MTEENKEINNLSDLSKLNTIEEQSVQSDPKIDSLGRGSVLAEPPPAGGLPPASLSSLAPSWGVALGGGVAAHPTPPDPPEGGGLGRGSGVPVVPPRSP